MSRGKAIQPDRDCEYCAKQLPALRHPMARYCNPICRQRDKLDRQRKGKGIKCLDCGKLFVRVGSHVVQVHGYESVIEYKEEYGLASKETHTEEHIALMRSKVTKVSIDNLENGKDNRYTKGGGHGERVSEFWKNRKEKTNLREA